MPAGEKGPCGSIKNSNWGAVSIFFTPSTRWIQHSCLRGLIGLWALLYLTFLIHILVSMDSSWRLFVSPPPASRSPFPFKAGLLAITRNNTTKWEGERKEIFLLAESAIIIKDHRGGNTPCHRAAVFCLHIETRQSVHRAAWFSGWRTVAFEANGERAQLLSDGGYEVGYEAGGGSCERRAPCARFRLLVADYKSRLLKSRAPVSKSKGGFSSGPGSLKGGAEISPQIKKNVFLEKCLPFLKSNGTTGHFSVFFCNISLIPKPRISVSGLQWESVPP